MGQDFDQSHRIKFWRLIIYPKNQEFFCLRKLSENFIKIEKVN